MIIIITNYQFFLKKRNHFEFCVFLFFEFINFLFHAHNPGNDPIFPWKNFPTYIFFPPYPFVFIIIMIKFVKMFFIFVGGGGEGGRKRYGRKRCVEVI